MIRITAIALVLMIMGITMFGQKFTSKDYLKSGDLTFQKKDYYNAAYMYSKSIQIQATDEAYYKLGEASRKISDYVSAKNAYMKVTADQIKAYPLAPFWLGEVYKNLGNYQYAQFSYKGFLRSYPEQGDYYVLKAKREIISCEKALDISMNPVGVVIHALDTAINSYHSDFAETTIHDSLFLYSSMQPDLAQDSAYFVKLYQSLQKDSVWTSSTGLSTTINKPGTHVTNPYYDEDTKTLYYSVINLSDSLPLSHIYKSSFTKDGFDEGIPLPPLVNLIGKVSTQPSVAVFGDKIYLLFVSDREGGAGNLDIWYAQILDDNQFGEVENIGVNKEGIDKELEHFYTLSSVVNSIDNEITPYYNSKDSTLYFSSTWHDGIGGYDIFSCKGDFTKWETPKNIGYPINSCANDMYYYIDSKHKHAYFASNRVGSLTRKNASCCNDIYTYEFPDVEDEEQIEENKILVFEQEIKLLVPLTLYFHNDRPNPRTTDTVTTIEYRTAYTDYLVLLEEYKMEYSKGISKKEKNAALLAIEDFFENDVVAGYEKLNSFAQLAESLLAKNQEIVITLQGFCSPLNNTEYNVKLAKRRISSLMNFFRSYNSGVFNQYEENGLLKYEEVAVGETIASNVSDDASDVRNSVYSPEASRERKIQIIAVQITRE